MDIAVHRTAIKRKILSKPMRWLLSEGIVDRSNKILDYGCGYGDDLAALRRQFYYVDGYDKHSFGFNEKPLTNFYDLCTLIYVLNVIPSMDERAKVLSHIVDDHMKESGVLFIAARSKRVIEKLAKKCKWEEYVDGYITKSNTFQVGYDYDLFLATLNKYYDIKKSNKQLIPTIAKIDSTIFAVTLQVI